MSEEAIRGLPLWKHVIDIEPLQGGITNLNFRVTDGDAVYAARIGSDDPSLGIYRHNEVACTRIAAALGIAPRVAFSEHGVLVSDFIDGHPLTPDAGRKPSTIERVARRLREIHRIEVADHLQYFSPFAVGRTYIEIATRRSLRLPAAATELKRSLDALESGIAAFRPAFCHNDLMPGNLLDDGTTMWVVDWEYGGIGHPIFDLAGYATNCELTPEQDEALLDSYFGSASDVDVKDFHIMKAAASLRESLWAVIQGAQSSIDFDYDGYRDENYQKYTQWIREV